MNSRCRTGSRSSQRGAALLIFALLVILGLLGAFFGQLDSTSQTSQRNKITDEALAQAKEALIGYAATYRDRQHPTDVFGYLPCPDMDTNGISEDADNDGFAESTCRLADTTVVGRLPWKTLGLPPLRDGAGECLWYAVSGSAKNSPSTSVFNWDTLGQLVIQDAGGTALVSTAEHDRPLAIVFSPGSVLGSQSRASSGTSECGGSNAAADYLEGLGILGTSTPPAAKIPSTILLANADSIRNGTNNDRGLVITSKEIFDRIKKRTDFGGDSAKPGDIYTLLYDLTSCLNRKTTATLATLSSDPLSWAPSSTNKGIDNIISRLAEANNCAPYNDANTQQRKVLDNWKDNLLYATMDPSDITNPSKMISVNEFADCKGVLIFSGERTGAQTRTPAEQGDKAKYLETYLSIFPDSPYNTIPAASTFPGTAPYEFNPLNPATDIARCIKGLPAGSTQVTFTDDFGTFVAAGPLSSAAVTPNATNQTVTITDASGTGNGCFWSPIAVPLAGKALRAYYEFQFSYPDKFSLGDLTTTDRGNGFTFQMVRSDVGAPSSTTCGTESAMGALGSADIWGSFSFIIETDVHKDTARSDPTENHTAIMTNGSLTHAAGTITTTCDGTASGCRHSPANKFEESPVPAAHNQRIEIHTGCNSTCTNCDPTNHVSPNTYARITAWVDCTDCNDVARDLNRTTKPPMIQRCTILNTEMNLIYFGFTGGFLPGATAGEAPAQSVTIKNLYLRSD